MDERQTELFDKLAELELLISDIYMKFSTLFPQDVDLWWRLSLEEKGHASIVRSGQQNFAPLNLFPEEFYDLSVQAVDRSLADKRETLKRIKENPSSFTRRKAIVAAIKIEEQDVENLFQELSQRKPDSRALSLFQRLNQECKDHAKRLLDYMEQHPSLRE